MDKKY